MKKRITIFSMVLITMGLMAFGFINWNDPVSDQVEPPSTSSSALYNPLLANFNDKADLDLVYSVESRYMATITKEALHKATSILDIVPKEAEGWRNVSFQTVTIAVLEGNDETRSIGDDKELNADQIELLQSIDYSTNFYIKAQGGFENYAYYFTVIPEKETEFTNGNDALIEYLKKQSKQETAIIEQNLLKPCKVNFTITKNGTIANVQLASTSGYPSIDKKMIELIANAPGKWVPAENSKGGKVDQELVFFFGLMGC